MEQHKKLRMLQENGSLWLLCYGFACDKEHPVFRWLLLRMRWLVLTVSSLMRQTETGTGHEWHNKWKLKQIFIVLQENKMGFAISKAPQPTMRSRTTHGPSASVVVLLSHLLIHRELNRNTFANRIHCCNYNLLHNCIYNHSHHPHTLRERVTVFRVLISRAFLFLYILTFRIRIYFFVAASPRR